MALINFSGLASGIDSTALIQAMLDQRRQTTIAPLDRQLQTLGDTNSAFEELRELLKSLQTAAGSFRTLNGGAIAKNVLSSDESKISASASNSALNGTYQVTVSTLARNATHSFDDRFASTTTVINSSIDNGAAAADRTVTYTIGTGANQETVSIELTNTTTAQEFVTNFNEQSSNATASLVNTGTSASPSYAIVVNSKSQGTAEGSISVLVGNEIKNAGSGAFSLESLEQASNAEFSILGIAGTITRPTNNVSDVIDGVNLNLIALGSANIEVSTDPEASSELVEQFVSAYNKLVKYIGENDLVTQETNEGQITNIFAPLATSSLDENVLSTLRTVLSGSNNQSGTVRILADLGITTERDGTLKFDETVFKQALASDSAGVLSLTEKLGEDLASVNGTIAQFTRFNGLLDQSVNSNKTQIDQITRRIDELEKYLEREKESLMARFARLESAVGRMSYQQNALLSLLPQ